MENNFDEERIEKWEEKSFMEKIKDRVSKPVIVIFVGLELCYGIASFLFERGIHNPFCNFLFHCGCTYADSWKNCNANPTSPTYGALLPKCPWCLLLDAREYFTNDFLILCMMVVNTLFIVYYLFQDDLRTLRYLNKVPRIPAWGLFILSVVCSIASYFGMGIIVGFFSLLFTDQPFYPTFIISLK